MLFLAVFCGFLAENQRERLVEHQQEKKYINNLLQDLKRDTVELSNDIMHREKRRISLDSFIYELSLPASNETRNSIYYNAARLAGLSVFNYSNSTTQQLMNSGLMRLIRNSDLVENTNSYDRAVTRHKVREDLERELSLEYNKAICFVLDPITIETLGDSLTHIAFGVRPDSIPIRPVFNPLLTKDPDKINLVKGVSAQLYNRNLSNYFQLISLRKQATGIIALIKKEYHLE